jgi:hypothetical protein
MAAAGLEIFCRGAKLVSCAGLDRGLAGPAHPSAVAGLCGFMMDRGISSDDIRGGDDAK